MLRRSLVPTLLLSALLISLAAPAAPGSPQPEVDEPYAAIRTVVRSLIEPGGLSARQGPFIDPNSYAAKQGPFIDPAGYASKQGPCIDPAGYTAKQGPIIDPNGVEARMDPHAGPWG